MPQELPPFNLHVFPYGVDRFVAFDPETKLFFRANPQTADVLRRLSRGEGPDSIGASLQLPRHEVAAIQEQLRNQLAQAYDRLPAPSATTEKREVCGKVSFHVSNDCNMRCIYCYASGGNYGLSRDKMSVEASLDILGRFYDHFDEVNEIMFFGGEPLLNFPAIEAVCRDLARRCSLDPSKRMPSLGMVTNLSAIPKGLPELIREFQLGVTVSLDGPSEVHDYNRPFLSGRGTHSVVSRNIKKLHELTGEPTMLEGTYTRRHVDLGISSQDLTNYFGSNSASSKPKSRTFPCRTIIPQECPNATYAVLPRSRTIRSAA